MAGFPFWWLGFGWEKGLNLRGAAPARPHPEGDYAVMVTELETGDVPVSSLEPVALTRNTFAPAVRPDRVWVMLPPETTEPDGTMAVHGPADVAACSMV